MNFFIACKRLEFCGGVPIEPAYSCFTRRIMATTAFKGTPVQTNSDLPATGSAAPDFLLIGADLSEKTLGSFEGKKKILTINPSYDTPVCQTVARSFNERAAGLDNVVVLVISPDLPFAQKRFCVAEGLEGVVPLSTFRGSFLEDYGVKMLGGAMADLAARAIVVVDENNKVVHTELVADIVQEPDYDAAIAAVK
jgi:thiol peroxidase